MRITLVGPTHPYKGGGARHTTELAHRCGLSAPGASQHLTALRDAGLVTAHRAGRSVLYARTSVADALLAPTAA